MNPKQRRIVIKVGTSTLTNELGKSNLRTIEKLAMTGLAADILSSFTTPPLIRMPDMPVNERP